MLAHPDWKGGSGFLIGNRFLLHVYEPRALIKCGVSVARFTKVLGSVGK